jgi:hypothetical protein
MFEKHSASGEGGRAIFQHRRIEASPSPISIVRVPAALFGCSLNRPLLKLRLTRIVLAVKSTSSQRSAE